MPMIITAAECDSIRKAIDILLDPVTLPNTTILLDIYAGYAVRRVSERLPASYVDTSGEGLAACIFSCAGLLIPAIKQINLERIAGHEKRFQPFDWDKRQKDLDSRVDNIIDNILAAISGSTHLEAVRPKMFSLAKANRADRR